MISAALTASETTLTIIVFTLVAAASVLVPVVAYLVASNRMTEPLHHLRAWLLKENATIMTVLLTVIGVSMIGKGLGAF